MTVRLDLSLIPDAPDLSFESSLWWAGVERIAGLDEAGRGAWAGPVAAAVVIFPKLDQIPYELIGIRDSKQLTPEKRSRLAPIVKQNAAAWGIGFASSEEIDATGILPATRLAMTRALQALESTAEHLLIDALFLPDVALPQTALIKGDQRSLSIAAASILAKVTRDVWMTDLSREEIYYSFANNKGYGTRVHHTALKIHGPCSQHRFSFAPVEELDKKKTSVD